LLSADDADVRRFASRIGWASPTGGFRVGEGGNRKSEPRMNTGDFREYPMALGTPDFTKEDMGSTETTERRQREPGMESLNAVGDLIALSCMYGEPFANGR
jgi:hypothetical protein